MMIKAWDFPKLLKEGKLPPALMFYGASPYMIDHYIEQSHQLLAPQDEACKLYFNEYTYNTAKAHLSQGSLFGGNNILIIKSEKKIPKKELDELVAQVQKSPGNFFLYGYYGSDHSSSNKSFEIKKATHCSSVRFFEPNFRDAMPLLQAEAQKLHLQIRNDVLSHLFNTENGDIALSINELSKLAILNRPIENKDIDTLVYSLADVKLDDIIAQVLEKKAFLSDLEKLMESGEDAVRIISNFSSYITLLLRYISYLKIYGNGDSRSIIGIMLPAHIHKQRIDLCKRFSLRSYQNMLQILLDCEQHLKSAQAKDNKSILLATLLKLQSEL